MAGGMTTSGGETLADRVAQTRARREAEALADRDAAERLDSPETVVPTVRHCWYDGPDGRQAALLLEWRQRAGLWSGRIMVARPDEAGWAMVSMWVDGSMLEAVERPSDAPR